MPTWKAIYDLMTETKLQREYDAKIYRFVLKICAKPVKV